MARYWFFTPRSNLDSWRFNEVENCEILGLWEQYCGPRYELVALRALCAGDAPRAVWAGGDERLLKNLFAAELPEELFRKVITFWAPVWK